MSGRATVSWQTSLADLSLILFMVTAAAVSTAPLPEPGGKARADIRQEIAGRSQRAEPLSVYIALPDAPPLAEWLSQQAPDPRQQLTITAPYEAAQTQSRTVALEAALALAGEAHEAGLAARIVLEPGRGQGQGQGEIRAELAFDALDVPR